MLWQEAGPEVEQPVPRGKSRANETSITLERAKRRRRDRVAIRAVERNIIVAGKAMSICLSHCPVDLYPCLRQANVRGTRSRSRLDSPECRYMSQRHRIDRATCDTIAHGLVLIRMLFSNIP